MVVAAVVGLAIGGAVGGEGAAAAQLGDAAAPSKPLYGPPLPPPQVDVEAVVRRAVEEARRAAEEAAKQAAVEEAARTRTEAEKELAVEREQRLDLARRLSAAEATLVREAEEPPPVRTARWGLSLTGFVQSDWVVHRQSSSDEINASTGAPLNEDRFTIRRARLRATIERTFVTGAVEFDGNTVRGTTARLIGAEASVRLPPPAAGAPAPIMATVGMFKTPFGYEVIESDRERLFLERSTAERALFPGEYDLGFRLQGGWRFVRYAVAVMNGEPVGETSSFAGRDPTHQKDFIGRLGIDTDIVDSVAISGGISALGGTGFHPGTAATKPVIIWQDRNEDGQFQPSEVSVAPGVAATASQTFSRQAIGADIRVVITPPASMSRWLGHTIAYAEAYDAKNLDRAILPADPLGFGATSHNFRELGYYAALIQEIGRCGAVGVRYDYYNPDRDSSDSQLGVLVPTALDYRTLSITGALVAPAGRLIVQYDINRNHLGRTMTGAPTNLADNAISIRGEARF